MRVVVDEGPTDVAVCIVTELAGRGHEVHTGADVREAHALVRMTGHDGVVISRVISNSEERVPNSAPNTLLVRTATIMGRDSAGPAQRRFAAPVILGIRNGRNVAQFIHHDDVARFVAEAVERPDWSGMVNLVASDTIALREVAAILDKRYVEINHKRAGEDLPCWTPRHSANSGSSQPGAAAIASSTSERPTANTSIWAPDGSGCRGDANGPGRPDPHAKPRAGNRPTTRAVNSTPASTPTGRCTPP